MLLKKRAQITVFIIIGLIILIVFLIMNKATNDVQKIKLEKEAEIIKSTVEQSGALQHYVKLCLRQSAENSLLLLGKQGGRIWDYQEGNSVLNNVSHNLLNLGNNSFNVAAGILRPKLNPSYETSWYFDVPWYPEDFKNYATINLFKHYYLGDNNLPYLCDKNGTNAFNNSNNSILGLSCMPKDSKNTNLEKYIGTDNTTIQIQLQDYTSKLLKKCVDPGFLKNFSGYDLTFQDPNTIVTFGEDNVFFNAYFPIEIKLQNTNSLFKRNMIVTKSTNFSTTIPVRLKKIYDLSSELIDNDIRNITFLLNENYINKESYYALNNKDNSIKLTIISSNNQFVNLINIEDQSSLINGVPYTFQFLRQNRPPILQFIHNYQGNNYDIVIPENSKITISPVGYDPDESYYDGGCIDESGNKCMTRNYLYSGWQETESYNFNNEKYLNCKKSESENNDLDCFNLSITNNQNDIKSWTNSNEFIETQRIATYQTSREDIGNHTLKISVCDEQGLCDFQEIKILVFDISKPIAESTNNYSDITSSHASIEDAYILTAVKSFIITQPSSTQTTYNWCDDKEVWCKTFLDVSVILPDSSFNINNIKEKTNLTKIGKHKLNLTLPPNEVESDELFVTVTNCLPHRSKSQSYPFNNFTYDNYIDEKDPFQSNHTCCSGEGSESGIDSTWGEVFGTSKKCYILDEYGTYKSFKSSTLEKIYDLPNISQNLKNIGYPPPTKIITYNNDGLIFDTSDSFNAQNDIFVREFTRNCDGERGNICGGLISDNIKLYESCKDNSFNEIRRCFGPSKTVFSSFENISYNTQSCVSYTDETFESIFQDEISEDKNICNNNPKCSSNDGSSSLNTGYSENGHYVCNATCGGENGCTKPAQCFDCYSYNMCSGPTSTNRYINQNVNGNEYDKCESTTSQCKTNFYSKTNEYIDTTRIIQYTCLPIEYQKTYSKPYESITIDCANGDSGAKCESDGTGKYHARTGGVADSSLIICKNSTYTSCGNFACAGNICRLNCNSSSDCIIGTHCVNSLKVCKFGIINDDCDDNTQCNPGLYCSLKKCVNKKATNDTCNNGYECISNTCKPTLKCA